MTIMQGAGKPFNGDTFLEAEMIRLRDLHGIKNVIETGTYHGDSTKFFAENFENVRTVEYKDEYFRTAQRKLKGFNNVMQLKGDSSVDLTNMLIGFKENLMIFLDAHWFANPVLKELEQISDAGIKPLIVIHDFFNVNDPTMKYDTYDHQPYVFDWIKGYIDEIYGVNGYAYHYNKEATGVRVGCIFIYPKI